MARPRIDRLHIQNYGCIKDVELELTPLHALIGPNDSGKSTVLMALRTLTTLAAGSIGDADDAGKLGSAIALNRHLVMKATVGHETWEIGWEGEDFREAVPGDAGTFNLSVGSKLLGTKGRTMAEGLSRSLLLRLSQTLFASRRGSFPRASVCSSGMPWVGVCLPFTTPSSRGICRRTWPSTSASLPCSPR